MTDLARLLPRPAMVRENLPLFGIGLLVLAALATLVFALRGPLTSVLDGARSDAVAGSSETPAGPVEALAELPATAESKAVITSDLDAASAQDRNGAIPIEKAKRGLARPFAFRGSAADRERAQECLALAGIAEAGLGDTDQRAVMQVILNRVRHPAFAKSVCGVVFEGSLRSTGCQFTFTCDGSLARDYPSTWMASARRRAGEALGGYVEPLVGNATHYHANYVYPWWSPKLDKVAEVGPHLFFKWRGYWGTPQALAARYVGNEPDPAVLRRAALAVEHNVKVPAAPAAAGNTEAVLAAGGETADTGGGAPGSPAPGIHFILVSANDNPAALVGKARKLCPGEGYCQVMGWTDAGAIPGKLPLTDTARGALRFSFLPAGDGSSEAVFFDCALWNQPALGRCLPKARP